MGVVVKGLGTVKDINKFKAHVKYIGFRSVEIGDKVFFDKDGENVNYKDFIDRVEHNPALKHSQSVKAHKLVFSLKDVDYNNYKMSGKDYKDLVRETLKQYEDKNNVKLDWIAVIHNRDGKGKNSHPHVHVVIKGVSDTKDNNGRFQRIRFTKDDFKFFRETFDKEFEKEATYEIFRQSEKYKEFDKTMKDIGKGFEAVLNSVKNDIEHKNAENEYMKDKAVRKEIRNKDNRDLEK